MEPRTDYAVLLLIANSIIFLGFDSLKYISLLITTYKLYTNKNKLFVDLFMFNLLWLVFGFWETSLALLVAGLYGASGNILLRTDLTLPNKYHKYLDFCFQRINSFNKYMDRKLDFVFNKFNNNVQMNIPSLNANDAEKLQKVFKDMSTHFGNEKTPKSKELEQLTKDLEKLFQVVMPKEQVSNSILDDDRDTKEVNNNILDDAYDELKKAK